MMGSFDVLSHLFNLSPSQTVQPANAVMLVLAFVVMVFLGVALRHLVTAAIALAVMAILLTVAGGLETNFTSVFAIASVAWNFFQPLLLALEALAFECGVYSLLISLAGFAAGFFFPRGPGV